MNEAQQLSARITACLATVELTDENKQKILDVLFDCRQFLETLNKAALAKERTE